MEDTDKAEDAHKPSKTRRKKDMHALQALGALLVDLNPAQLAEIDMPERLRAAVLEAKRTRSHEGLRRQIQYIGRVMRDVDPEPIRARLDAWRGLSLAAVATMHTAERWRERLLADDNALTEFADDHPASDVQHLRALIRNVRAEIAAHKPPRNYRALYREIRSLLEAPKASDAE